MVIKEAYKGGITDTQFPLLATPLSCPVPCMCSFFRLLDQKFTRQKRKHTIERGSQIFLALAPFLALLDGKRKKGSSARTNLSNLRTFAPKNFPRTDFLKLCLQVENDKFRLKT